MVGNRHNWDLRSSFIWRDNNYARQKLSTRCYDFTLINWVLLSRSSAHRLSPRFSFSIQCSCFSLPADSYRMHQSLRSYTCSSICPSRPKGRDLGIDSGARTQMVHALPTQIQQVGLPRWLSPHYNHFVNGLSMLWNIGCSLVLTDKL